MATTQQLELAILTAFSLNANVTSESRHSATLYCDEVKYSENGWMSGIDLFMKSNTSEIRFFALSIFQEGLEHKSGVLCKIMDSNHRMRIKECLMSWLRSPDDVLAKQEKYFLTKVSVILVLLLKTDFPDNWPNAITELSDLIQLGHSHVEFFLRFLDTLDEEVVKFNSLRTEMEARLAMHVKDSIRSMQISKKICSIARDTAIYYRNDMPLLSAYALEVYSKFIPWFDISLTANESVLPILYEFVKEIGSMSDISKSALLCLKSLVQKGMGLREKLHLIDGIGIVEVLKMVRVSREDCNPALLSLADLTNALIVELLAIWGKRDELPDNESDISILLSQSVPLIFPLLQHDNMEVFECIEESGYLLIQCMKHEASARSSDENQSDPSSKSCSFSAFQYAPTLLEIVYSRMQYPTDFEFDLESEEDQEQELFRANLRKMYVNICNASPTLVLEFICNTLAAVSNPLSSSPWTTAEAMLRILYHFFEGCSTASATLNAQNLIQEGTFCEIIAALHRSDIAAHPHYQVVTMYYTLTVRYSNILKANRMLLPHILENICGSNGISNANYRVRENASGNLTRLVKSLGQDLQPYVSTMVPVIANLLLNLSQMNVSAESILNLYETAGMLIGSEGVSSELAVTYLDRVMSPLLYGIHEGIETGKKIPTDPQSEGSRLAFYLAGLANVSKGFTKRTPAVLQPFSQELEAATTLLQLFPTHPEVRSKTIFVIHRMVPVLGEDLLPMVGSAISILISYCTGDDLEEVVQLVNQFAQVFCAQAMPFMSTIFFPLISKIFELMPGTNSIDSAMVGSLPGLCKGQVNSSSTLLSHERVDRSMKLKIYFGFLTHLLSNGMFGVFCDATNIGHLDCILDSVSFEIINDDDPLVFKSCANFLLLLFDAVLLDRVTDSNVLQGVMTYVTERGIPLLFRRIFSSRTNLKDAHTASAVNMLGTLLFNLKTRGKQEFFSFLSEIFSEQSHILSPEKTRYLMEAISKAKDGKGIGKEIRQVALAAL